MQKQSILIVFVLVLTAGLSFGTADPNTPKPKPRFKPPEQQVDSIIDRIRQTDPNKAAQLEKMRQDEPEKFKAALGKAMRDEMTAARRPMNAEGKGVSTETSQSSWSKKTDGKFADLMSKRYDDHLKWLKENYPEDANTLSVLKEKQPEKYKIQAEISIRKYGQIEGASKTDPELAKILKEELEVQNQVMDAVVKIRAAEGDKKKESLRKELDKAVNAELALDLKKKQHEQQKLQKKLADLQKQLKDSEAEIKKCQSKEYQQEQADQRIKQLLDEKEKGR